MNNIKKQNENVMKFYITHILIALRLCSSNFLLLSYLQSFIRVSLRVSIWTGKLNHAQNHFSNIINSNTFLLSSKEKIIFYCPECYHPVSIAHLI